MVERDQIRSTVFRAIDRVNELSLDEGALVNGESDVLVGDGAALDSMGFVNFVVAVEEEMAEVSDRPLDLVQVLEFAGFERRARIHGRPIDRLSL